MNIDKQTFNTLDVLYDDKKWGKRIDPDEWNANFKVLEQGHNDLAVKLNQQVFDIDTAIQAATSNGGQNISVQYGIGTETLQDALDNVVSDINNRYTKNEVDASIGSNTNSLIANAEYNESTGVFTFTRKDGSSVVVDTVIEKVPASMALVNESDGSVSLVVTNQDGSTTKTNVTSLIEDTVINSSDTVNATYVTDAVKKVTTYTLVIKPNSIGLSHIDSALTAKFEETQSAKTAAIQAKDNAVAAQNAAIQAKNNAETYASNANTYSTNASVSADESADSALEANGYAEQAASYKNSAELAKVAAEKARDQAQSIVGGDYANITPIIIPAGRMRGDVDGDGKITQGDRYVIQNGTGSAGKKYYNLNLSTTFPDGNVPLDYLAANINGDWFINSTDINLLLSPTFKAGAFAEITGNWTNNPNYAAEESQFYVDISITGMTENHSAAVLVKGEFWKDTFIKAECIAGAIRIYTKFCPIAETQAVVSWGSGNGTAVITSEKETNEQEIFVAEAYVTTYEEINKAYLSGKPCFCKNGDIMYLLCGNFADSFLFSALITDFTSSDSKRNYYASYLKCKKVNDEWVDLCENGYVKMLNPASNGLPDVTTADNGKIPQVVDGVWTAVNNLSTVFTATYGTTTSAEIEEAYQAGKMILCKRDDYLYVFGGRSSAVSFYFIGGSVGTENEFTYVTCSNDTWTKTNACTVPKPTASDSGKVLTVGDFGEILWSTPRG